MKHTLWAAAALGLSAPSFNAALAHGEGKPSHGGVVAAASDLHGELVGTTTGAALYIDDHGKLSVLNGTERSEAALVVAGDRLEAQSVKLVRGARVVASLTTPARKAATVRFTIR